MIFVKVKDGIVVESIVADQEFMDSYIDTTPGTWLETKEDGSIRKNYAGIGYTYDATRDAFIPPKQYESWILEESTCLWKAPTAMPDDGNVYIWNETDQQWDEVT